MRYIQLAGAVALAFAFLQIADGLTYEAKGIGLVTSGLLGAKLATVAASIGKGWRAAWREPMFPI